MSNTFKVTDESVLDAAILLSDNMGIGELVNRNHEEKFVGGKGDSIRVKGPVDLGAPNELTTTTSATTLTETETTLELEKHFYQLINLTPKQETLDVMDFTTQILGPMVKSVSEGINNFISTRIAAGFAPQIRASTVGTAPATLEDIALAVKKIKDNRVDTSNLVGMIGTTAEASFSQLAQFSSADYGIERPMALRDGSLGKLKNVNFFVSQDVGTSDQGDVAGTVLLKGAGTAGDTSVTVDGLTATTGTIYEGTRFTIAGTATVYTVTEDATIASNEATLNITPALSANEDDDDAVTFATAHTMDSIYNPNFVAAAIVPPAPLRGAESAIAFYNGYGIRVSALGSTSTGGNGFLVDTLAACKVIKSEGGCVFQA